MKPSIRLLFVGHILACSASSVEITANVCTSYVPHPSQPYSNHLQFDNLTVVPVPIGGVGTYEDVVYNVFALAEQSIAGTGVAAHTPPNVIDTTSQQQGTNGTPSLTPAAPYTSIGLVDFWFGCNLRSGQGAVAVQTPCTIVVAAFNKQDKEVAVASYTFTPPTAR